MVLSDGAQCCGSCCTHELKLKGPEGFVIHRGCCSFGGYVGEGRRAGVECKSSFRAEH